MVVQYITAIAAHQDEVQSIEKFVPA